LSCPGVPSCPRSADSGKPGAVHIALWRARAVEGDFGKGRRIMSALMPLMRGLERGGKFIQCIKHGCETNGFHAGPPRPPLKPPNKDDQRQPDWNSHPVRPPPQNSVFSASSAGISRCRRAM
jgi:hypothetical protein